MSELLALAAVVVIVAAPGIVIARLGLRATGVGTAVGAVVVVLAALGWMLSGLSEYPSYPKGHPDRPHLTNTSGRTWWSTSVVPSDEIGVDYLRPIAPGQRVIFTSSTFQPRDGDVCFDHETFLVGVRDGTSIDRQPGSTVLVGDLDTLALPTCMARGEHELSWDGDELTHDPDWSPPLVHPSDRLLVGGAALGALSVSTGIGVDVVQRLRRRRTPTMPDPQSRPCSTA